MTTHFLVRTQGYIKWPHSGATGCFINAISTRFDSLAVNFQLFQVEFI